MRPRLLLLGPAVFALVLGACGTDLPKLPGQVAANGNREAQSAAGAATADMMLRPNVRYELAKGVTVEAKSSKAYQLGDGSSAATAKLAKAFGVTGQVRAEPDGGWSVGQNSKELAATQTSGALFVTKNGGSFSMYWSYPTVNSGSGCAGPPAKPTTSPDGSVSSDTPADEPACEYDAAPSTTTTVVPGAALTKADARRIATDALDAGGVNLHDPEVTVESFDDSAFNVRFRPTIDGVAVDGYEASVTVDATKKITGANGFVGELNSLGSYDLATLERAVDRLNESMTQPYAVDDRASATDMGASAPASSGGAEPTNPSDVTQVAPVVGAGTSEPGTSEPVPGVGGPIPPVDASPRVITLTKASVGSMLQGDSKGALFLVPAYLFTSDSDDHVVAAAADDKYIEQPATDTTITDGGKRGGGSGGSDGGSTGGDNTGGTRSGACSGSDLPPAGADRNDITAQVCASSTTVKAGQSIIFTITASDPDRAFTDGPCGDGVNEEYGDGGPGAVRCMACAASVADGPGKVERKREHTYATPGTYTANFTVTSGTMCEKAPQDSTATLSLQITVV